MTEDCWLERLEQELHELEERDPAVKAARERLDEVTTPHEFWRRQMVRDLWAQEEA